MKKLLGIAAAAAMGISLFGSVPAQAASYTIYGGSTIGGLDSPYVFRQRGCQAADARPVTEGGLTGIDSIFADISGRPVINATWSAQARVEPLAAILTATFIGADCRTIGTPSAVQSQSPGGWSFNPPAGTRWLVITSRAQVGVTVSF